MSRNCTFPTRLVLAVTRRRRCELCKTAIPIGKPAQRMTGVVEGRLYTYFAHPGYCIDYLDPIWDKYDEESRYV